MHLSPEHQAKARTYLYQSARPLERARYEHTFADGSASSVLAELAAFQNDDGGFGHGLEADVRTPASSAIATSVALQVVRDLQTSADHPLVQGAIGYLVDTYDPGIRAWEIVPPATNDAPHAPWWNYDDGLPERFGHYKANPRAELLGYLYDYGSLVPADLLATLSEDVIAYLEAQPDEIEMHDLMCYIRLSETATLPEDLRRRLLDKLTRAVTLGVARTRAQWATYGLTPLGVITHPDSPFAPLFQSEIADNLDFVIEQQRDDGAWGPAWSWSEQYPDAWAEAERDICGLLTFDNLRTLRAFGRLA